MSTIRVNTIQNTSTTDGGISIDTSGHVTVDGVAYPSAGPLSNRNLVINGAMQVAQRGTQVTGVTATGYRTCDQIKPTISNLGTWTVDRDTNAPNGFSNSFKLTCTTADASPASGDLIAVMLPLEAQNLQALGYGTAGAQPITLSFWVRSNKTGNASFGLLQSDNSNKQVSFQYSISSADTWEHKTITIPADTAGVINNDNGEGFQLEWWLNSGSSFTGGSHQTTWTTFNNANRNVSNLGVGGATSDYWQITGVQLEVGSVATPFDHRSFGDELARCQRYYFNAADITGAGDVSWPSLLVSAGGTYVSNCRFPVPMRTPPSLVSTGMTGTGTCFLNWPGSGSSTLSTVNQRHSSTNTGTISGGQDTSFGGAGFHVNLEISDTFTGTYGWSAEL